MTFTPQQQRYGQIEAAPTAQLPEMGVPPTQIEPASGSPLVQRVTNESVDFDLPRPNLLRNGGFEIWSHGPGPFSEPDEETADGWFTLANRFGDTATIQQDQGIIAPAGSTSALRVSGTSLISNLVAQTIDPVLCALNDVTVSFSCLTLAPVGTEVQGIIGVLGDIGFQLAEALDGSGTWQQLRMTCHLPPTPMQPVIVVLAGIGVGEFLFDNATLVVGTVPSNYQPTSPTLVVQASSFTHVQLAPTSTWIVAHNMGSYPSVTVVDSGNSVIIPDVHYDSANVLSLNFGSPTSGKAYVN